MVGHNTLRKPIRGTSPSQSGSYEEVTDWLYPLITERLLSASSVNVAVNAVRFLYAVTLGRETARLDGIGPAHEARHPAGGSLRAQRGRSDLDGVQTAARPGAFNDGLWLRAANFGGHTAQDQRHRPPPVCSCEYETARAPRDAFCH